MTEKLYRNTHKDHQLFWQNVDKAIEKVKTWPEWKRNIKLTTYDNSESVN